MSQTRKAYEDTTVSVSQSQAEIRALLIKYGATQFGITEQAGWAAIGFVAHARMIKIEVPLPDCGADVWTRAGRLHRPGTPAARTIHEQEERRLWRAARHWIKAQLAAVEAGIRTFEEAFLADTVLPSGQRFAEWAEPQMEQATRFGRMPAQLTLGVAALPAPGGQERE